MKSSFLWKALVKKNVCDSTKDMVHYVENHYRYLNQV